MTRKVLKQVSFTALYVALLCCLSSILVVAQNEGNDQKLGAKIRAGIQTYVNNKSIAGAVIVVLQNDKIISVESIGYGDLDKSIPMQSNTLFWIASQTKPITACALMILVDEGKVDVNDPVEKYLPEFKDVKIWRVDNTNRTKAIQIIKPENTLLVRHLLSHTSGLPFKSSVERPTLDQLPLHLRVKSYSMTPLDFEPGTKYQYSNAGINTVAKIIEVASGMAYEEFLQTRIFDPLGMKDTSFWPDSVQLDALANSYKWDWINKRLYQTQIDQLRYPLNDHENRYPMPAGGLFSTASDMAKFCQLIVNKGTVGNTRLLSEKSIETMISKQTNGLLDGDYGYGFGWEILNKTQTRVGHGGADGTRMIIDTEADLVLLWMVAGGLNHEPRESFERIVFEYFGKN